MIPPHLWLETTVVVLVTAAIQGLTGFGFALTAVPLLVLLHEPHVAIEIGMILSTVSSIIMWMQTRSHQRLPINRRLYISAIVGLPLGFYVLNHMNTAVMRLIVGGLTLGLAAAFAFVLPRRAAAVRAVTFASGPWPRVVIGTGFISGFLMGSVSMAGPPVVALLTICRVDKTTARATMVEFFALIYATAFVFAVLSATISSRQLVYSAGHLPALLAGTYLGGILHKGASQRLYTAGTLLLIALAGATCLWSGAASL